MELKEELKSLYLQTSKHSNYQILPQELADILEIKEDDILSTYEKERFDFICKNISLKGTNILDIGGNTGYFTFESVKQGCRHVDYYEGNPLHARFVSKAKPLFQGGDIDIYQDYYLFDEKQKKYDVVLCLNVIHHLGDDFLSTGDMKLAKTKMIACINQLAYVTEYLVFQMGYNWCGDCNLCLFENGTKQEMINFISQETDKHWTIANIGIAEKKAEGIIYNQLNEENNVRIDRLGEFLNRPLFIMKSKISEE